MPQPGRKTPGIRFKVAGAEVAYVKRKKFLAAWKLARGCADCKLPGPHYVLTFDHVRGEKQFAIGSHWSVSMVKLLAELEKCDIVCWNCHMAREWCRKNDCEKEDPWLARPRRSGPSSPRRATRSAAPV